MSPVLAGGFSTHGATWNPDSRESAFSVKFSPTCDAVMFLGEAGGKTVQIQKISFSFCEMDMGRGAPPRETGVCGAQVTVLPAVEHTSP